MGRFLLRLAARRHCGIVDGRLGVQDVVQTAHGSGAALEDIGDEAQRDHGEDQAEP